MQANRTKQQYSVGLLSEPHFEDEATLLSARPVVPLHEIKTAERSSKRLVFGLALIVALMVGAFGASLIYRQQNQSPASENFETGKPETDETAVAPAAAMEAGGGVVDAPAPASSVSAKVSETARESRGVVAASPSRKPATSTATNTGWTKPNNTGREEVNNDEVSNQEAEQAARRAERQEARRLRREAWGDVRRRRVQHSDDLLRIREIFEGPARPPRFQRWQ